MDSYEIAMRILFTIFLIIIIVFVTLVWIDSVTFENMRIEKVKCYDRFSNEINNLTCDKEITCGIVAKKLNLKYCYKEKK